MLFEQGLKSKEGNAQYSLAGSHLTGDERALQINLEELRLTKKALEDGEGEVRVLFFDEEEHS
jgi:hypothetical protein